METSTQSQTPTKPADQMLNAVGDFIRQHLICSDHQLVLLTAWVLHTWCYRAFPVTPYLNIQTPGPQSGKTRCLRLLQLLCPSGSWYTSSPAPKLFMKRLLTARPEQSPGQEPVLDLPAAVFLDNREFTIGNSENHPIIPLLNSGVRAADRYLHQFDRSSLREVSTFCPKVFAGTTTLPRALAQNCLPLPLQRRKTTEKVEQLSGTAVLYAKPLIAWMQRWAEENFKMLAARASTYAMEPSERLTPRERELGKPLLILAHAIGGKWLDNVSASLQWLYIPRDPDTVNEGLQLLTDLRRAFSENSNPAWISSRDLIPYLRGLENRNWIAWGGAPEFSMARLLRPFGVSSSPQRISSDSVLKVYRCADLEEAWSRYL